MYIYYKKALARIFLRQIRRIMHDDFSVYSRNTKSFYHGLKEANKDEF